MSRSLSWRRLAPLLSAPLATALLSGCGGDTPCASCAESGGAAGHAGTSAGGAAGSSAGGASSGGASSGGSGGDAGAGGNQGQWSFEPIGTSSADALDQTWQVELYAARRPDGGTSYLLYIPAKTPNARVVVITQPYAGIDWTGDDLDARWATLGAGAHPDVDAPGYDGDDLIAYSPHSIGDAVNEAAVHLVNGRAVVQAYARFYAGGSLEDDVLDATAPYFFLKEKSAEVNADQVAAFGNSWGGMMALFGAARAPAEVNVRAIAALNPPSDFADMVQWVTSDLPAVYPRPADVERFFSPYLRRIRASTGQGAAADYAAYQPTAVCGALRADVLVPHDTWDTLVPQRQTVALETACAGKIRGLYWWRPQPTDYDAVNLDHGLLGKEPGYPSAYTFAITHVGLAMNAADEPFITFAHTQALVAFLTTVAAAQAASADSGAARESVLQLADARVQVYDLESSTWTSGAALVASAVNQVWATSYDASNIASALSAGFPN